MFARFESAQNAVVAFVGAMFFTVVLVAASAPAVQLA